MQHNQNHLSDPTTHSRGMTAEMKRLRANSGASLAELREFVTHLKGRSPQEMLGVVAQSNLFRSLILATLGTVAIIAVFTVVPYLTAGDQSKAAQEADLVKEREQLEGRLNQLNALLADYDAKNNPQPAEEPQPAVAETPADQPVKPAEQNPLQQAAKAMGEDEVKNAPSKQNPLDGKVDDLLDLNDN